ncbi:hypothetical protein L1887_60086 [Cichorium endivia]|nr:hypothetical protein L1887_60086 [Cichorium endivia]
MAFWFSTMGHLQADIDHGAGSGGFGQATRSGRHGVEFFRLHQHLVQAFSELRCASCRLWHQEGGAFTCQIMGVVGLVVVDRMGQRHQQRWQAGRGQLADGQRAGTAHHQIGPAIGLGHVLDERLYLSLDPRFAIALGGDLVVIPTGLVEHLGPDVFRHQGEGLRQQLVQRLGAEAAAQHQQARTASGQGFADRLQEQFGTYRVAGGAALGTGIEGVREGFADTPSQRHEHAVRSAGTGILLVDHHRHTGQFRRHAARAGHITTEADHADRLQLANDPACLKHRLDQGERCLEQRQLALAAQAGDVDQVQLQAGLRHQFVLDPAGRAQPVHGEAARLELPRAGQRREHMAAGTAGHDQYILAVRAALPFDAQQQPDAGTADHQGTAAVAEEGQGQALGRQQADVHPDVDKELADPQERQAERHVGGEELLGLLGPQADVQGAHGDEDEQRHGQQRADHAELLGENGEHEVGVRFRQVELLLHAVAQADAEPFATTEGDQRLGQLVAGAELIGPGVGEGNQTRHPVGLGLDQDEHCAHRQHYHQAEAEQPHPAEEQHRCRGAHHHDRGAEVRLHQQQAGHGQEDNERFEEAHPALAHFLLAAHQVAGEVDNDEDLGNFRRLHVEEAETDPAHRTVHFAADPGNQHRDQQAECADQHEEAHALPGGDRHHHGDDARGDADGHVDQVANHVIQRIARLRRSHFRGRRGDHHQAQAEQGQAAD